MPGKSGDLEPEKPKINNKSNNTPGIASIPAEVQQQISGGDVSLSKSTTHNMNSLMMTGGGGVEAKPQEEYDENGNKNTSVVMTGTTNMGPPQNKKHIVINTAHCRQEIDTVQYVISKCGYRE